MLVTSGSERVKGVGNWPGIILENIFALNVTYSREGG